jgi:hypothetical protein
VHLRFISISFRKKGTGNARRMEYWNNGKMEEWSNGKMEEWNSGKME